MVSARAWVSVLARQLKGSSSLPYHGHVSHLLSSKGGKHTQQSEAEWGKTLPTSESHAPKQVPAIVHRGHHKELQGT